eukprot:3478214-Rhodomonas_salina.2
MQGIIRKIRGRRTTKNPKWVADPSAALSTMLVGPALTSAKLSSMLSTFMPRPSRKNLTVLQKQATVRNRTVQGANTVS